MENNIVIFKELTTEEQLIEIEEQSKQYQGLIVDMNKPNERKKVKESASLINDMLKTLDRARIDKAKDFKSKVEAEAELIRNRLETANKPLTALIDAHAEEQRKIRDAEKARQDSIQLAFDKMNEAAMSAIGQRAVVIETIIDDLADFDFNPDVFMEQTNKAVTQHAELMQRLSTMLKAQIASEELETRQAEFEEFQRKQKEQEEKAERERLDNEIREQAKIDAEARHAKQLEQAKVDAANAAKQAEIDKQEAIKQAKLEQIAEQQRLADIEVRKQAKLEADKKHVGAIRGAAKDCLIEQGLTEQQAKDIVLAISKGLIKFVTINY